MTTSTYPKQQSCKGLAILSVTAFLFVALAGMQSVQAELIIHNSVDETGQASMIVSNDRQKELPPAQLGISPAQIKETVSLTQSKNLAKLNQSLTLYNYGSKPKKISLSLIDVDESGTPIAPSESTLKPWTLINPTHSTYVHAFTQRVWTRYAQRYVVN